MRLPARTLLVLVLCLAVLAGASAQASYFSSFFSGGGDGSGEDWEDVEDALPDATHLEEDAPVDVKLRALMADAASFGADADGIRDADFEAQDDAFLEDALGTRTAASSCRSGDPERETLARRRNRPGGHEPTPEDKDVDDADVLARMAALEAGRWVSSRTTRRGGGSAGSDGERRVRAPRTLLTPRDDDEHGSNTAPNTAPSTSPRIRAPKAVAAARC